MVHSNAPCLEEDLERDYSSQGCSFDDQNWVVMACSNSTVRIITAMDFILSFAAFLAILMDLGYLGIAVVTEPLDIIGSVQREVGLDFERVVAAYVLHVTYFNNYTALDTEFISFPLS